MKKAGRWLCCAVVFGALVCSPRVGSAGEPSPILFTDALVRDGFHVTPGGVEVWNLAKAWCESRPGIEHAWYNNNAPYLVLMVPRSAKDPERVLEFKIRQDEAIVLIGRTPPPERYFAFYSWISSKVYPDGSRLPQLLVGAVDPVNNLSIKTDTGKPFDSRTVLVFTPDQGTYARVLRALEHAGYSEDYVNVVVYPSSMLNLGHGDAADTFRVQMRNAMWEDGYEAAGEAYIRDAPIQIFRVTPRAPTNERDLAPFPMPSLRIRGTGRSELYLWNELGDLRQGIIEGNRGMHATDVPVNVPVGYEGIDFLQRAAPVGGDARDAFCLQAGYLPEFLSWDRQITLADDEFLMVYGANHVATGKTTYMSVGVYTGDVKDGKLSIGSVDDRKFAGTATPYLPRGDAAASLMYAYKISRSCGGEPNCLQVPSKDLVESCTRLSVGPDTVLGLLLRMYLEPATMSGAAMQEVLYDRVLKFSPRKPVRE